MHTNLYMHFFFSLIPHFQIFLLCKLWQVLINRIWVWTRLNLTYLRYLLLHPEFVFSTNTTNHGELYRKQKFSYDTYSRHAKDLWSRHFKSFYYVRESFSSCADLLTRWSCMKGFFREAEGKEQTISPREDEDGVRNKWQVSGMHWSFSLHQIEIKTQQEVLDQKGD